MVPTVLHGADFHGFQNSFVHDLDFGRVHVYDHQTLGLSISEQTKVWDGTHRPKGTSQKLSSRPTLKLGDPDLNSYIVISM